MIRPVVLATVLTTASLSVSAGVFGQTQQGGSGRPNPSQHGGSGQSQQGTSGQSSQGASGQSQQGTPGHAQQGSTGQPSQGGTHAALSKSDREFVDEAALGGLFEVKAGEVAQQRAESREVKQFAQRMIDDHTAANTKLSQIMKQKGLTAPQALDKKHQDKINKLTQKSGAEFDRDYMSAMVDDHNDDVDKFEKAAKDAKDPDVKSFAQTTLPTLREHQASARQIHDQVKKVK